MKHVIAGDLGGTKTRLALLRVKGEQAETLAEATYASASEPCFERILDSFVAGLDRPADAAGFGIAGPVHGGRCQATNLPWRVDSTTLSTRLGLPVALINDLVATAWGIPALAPEARLPLQAGTADPAGNLAVVAAGTGLGEAGLCRGGNAWLPIPSEGGHSSFSPVTDLDIALLQHLRRTFGHVSWERVLSGQGLVNIHGFLRIHREQAPPPTLQQAMANGDPAAAIARAAIEGHDPVCREALDIFCRLYGAEAGNYALKVMATGGVFIGGGIAPKIVTHLRDSEFLAAFRDKGRMAGLLERIPVTLIMDDRAALLGAGLYAAGLSPSARH